jgi:hypothetical protein
MAGTSRGTLHSISIKFAHAHFNLLFLKIIFSCRPFKEHHNIEAWAGNPQKITCMQWFDKYVVQSSDVNFRVTANDTEFG